MSHDVCEKMSNTEFVSEVCSAVEEHTAIPWLTIVLSIVFVTYLLASVVIAAAAVYASSGFVCDACVDTSVSSAVGQQHKRMHAVVQEDSVPLFKLRAHT